MYAQKEESWRMNVLFLSSRPAYIYSVYINTVNINMHIYFSFTSASIIVQA